MTLKLEFVLYSSDDNASVLSVQYDLSFHLMYNILFGENDCYRGPCHTKSMSVAGRGGGLKNCLIGMTNEPLVTLLGGGV